MYCNTKSFIINLLSVTVFFLLSGLFTVAYGAVYIEDFDSGSYTGPEDTFLGNITGTGLSLSIDTGCETTPKCIRRSGSGSIHRGATDYLPNDNNQGKAIIYAQKDTLAQNHVYFDFTASTSGGYGLSWANTVVTDGGLGVTGETITSTTTQTDTWYALIIEWRAGAGDYLQFRGGVGQGVLVETTDWKDSAVLKGKNIELKYGLGKSTGAGLYPHVDSFYMETGGDYNNPNTGNNPLTPYATNYNYDTRITDVVVSETGTGDKDMQLDISYYLDPDEVDDSDPSTWPTQLCFSFAVTPQTSWTKYCDYIDPSNTGDQQYTMVILSGNLDPNDGTFDGLVDFGNPVFLGTDSKPFPDVNYSFTFVRDNDRTTSVFNAQNYNGQNNVENAQVDCKITDLRACVILLGNTMVGVVSAVFWSGDPLTGYFEETVSLMSTVAPFSFFYAINAIFDEIVYQTYDTPTLNISSGDSPFSYDVEIFSEETVTRYITQTGVDAIYALMTLMVWLSAVLYIYSRVSKMFRV